MIKFSLIIAGAVLAVPFQNFNEMRDCQTAGINLAMLLDTWRGYKIECKNISTEESWMIAAGDGEPTPMPNAPTADQLFGCTQEQQRRAKTEECP